MRLLESIERSKSRRLSWSNRITRSNCYWIRTIKCKWELRQEVKLEVKDSKYNSENSILRSKINMIAIRQATVLRVTPLQTVERRFWNREIKAMELRMERALTWTNASKNCKLAIKILHMGQWMAHQLIVGLTRQKVLNLKCRTKPPERLHSIMKPTDLLAEAQMEVEQALTIGFLSSRSTNLRGKGQTNKPQEAKTTKR